MKTKEELSALKNEVEALNAKLAELSEEELMLVTGGVENPFDDYFPKPSNDTIYEQHFYYVK